MSDRSRPPASRRFSHAIAAIGTLSGAIALDLASSSLAHNVKIDGEVGATFHLEPDHNPKSGETSTVWFALTREGGESIPLADCDCELTVTNAQEESIEADVSELTAIDVETYTDIPSAEIIFPEPGVYALTIGGAASDEASEPFAEFELTYDVTVGLGDGSAAADAEDEAEGDEASEESETSGESVESGEEGDETALVDSWGWLIGSLLMLGAGAGLAIFLVARWFWKQAANRLARRPQARVAQTVAASVSKTPLPSETKPDTKPEPEKKTVAEPEQTDDLEPEPDSKPEPQTEPAAGTSAIVAEAIPAEEVSETADREAPENPKSGDPKPAPLADTPEDAISAIKDWD
ncbi:MAG: hypothetical protein ACFB9N_02715 [Geitlerinemataceae cyanobacterium]